jgi:flagellin
MGMRINTNTQAIAAQRNLSKTTTDQKTSLERLSSGSRINRAADDAAGLAISEKMRAALRSLRQDQRNTNDGIAMIQTAEGAMNEMSNVLIRLRELSVQSASDTISDVERGFIDKEVQVLRAEMDRVSNVTEFNGLKLLNGDGDSLHIQIGMNNDSTNDRVYYDRQKTEISSKKLGIEGITVADRESAQGNLGKLDGAIRSLSESRAELGALQNRLSSTFSNLQVYEENLAGAKSRISDVDVAQESAELTKQNILSQAGVSVLSQANQNPQMALKLIG